MKMRVNRKFLIIHTRYSNIEANNPTQPY